MKLKAGDYVKIKDADRWNTINRNDYVDGELFVYQIDSTRNMSKFFGKVIKVFAANIDDKSFEDKNGWYWNNCAVEKLITKQEYPEYFI